MQDMTVHNLKQILIYRLSALSLGVWLGMQLTAGYIAAPLLFRHFPPQQAGEIAGILFDWVHYCGLAAWLAAYILIKRHQAGHFYCYERAKAPALTLTMLVLLAVSQFLVTPVIEAFKNQSSHWLPGLLGGSFKQWHAVSGTLYLCTTLLGLCLTVRYLWFTEKWRF